MASFPDKDWCVKAHSRLIGEDPTASADLYRAIFSPLVGWLHAKYRATDREPIRDATTDALVDYIKHPKKWDPIRGTLISYICMAADRDLQNALKKLQRRRKHEVLSADVEDEALDGNVLPEGANPSDALASLLPALETHLTSERDRRLLNLMLEGERSTDKFSEVLGIQNLPKQQKARTVKQHKDRLKKVIQRLRTQLNAK